MPHDNQGYGEYLVTVPCKQSDLFKVLSCLFAVVNEQ